MIALHKTLYFKAIPVQSIELFPKLFLNSICRISYLSHRKEQLSFYDTFEWQAFEDGFAVIKKKNNLVLADLKSGHEILSAPFTERPSFFFPKELRSDSLKEQLQSCSNSRAFIRLTTISVLTRSYRILDENEKTTGMLTATSLSQTDKKNQEPFAHFLSLHPLKGYQKEMEMIEKLLSNHEDFGKVLDFKELFLLVMKTAGRNVQDYSSKIILTLDAAAPIHESTQQLLQSTLSLLQQNEYGIKENIDAEFLHDYRVAIRRTRSVLKQLKGVYEPGETDYYLNLFKELGTETNELRDHDVLLLRQEIYRSYLPAFLKPPLTILFSDIEASRKALHTQVCRYLASSAYHSSLEEWDRVVHRELLPNPEHAPNAALSTMIVAVATIKKAWKKVIRHGRQISKETTDAELHALRIDCKKLRYLLEFFASIFPHKTITPVIRQMKELQENLGDFVDFAVQLRFLHERLTALSGCREDIVVAASIGGLMATLFQKQEEARQRFHKTFKSFDHEKCNQLFHQLLTPTSAP